MTSGITSLRIIFGSFNEDENDDHTEIVIALPKRSREEFYAFDTEQLVTLPNGEVLNVHAEVSLESDVADISLSILDGDRLFAIRCGSGLVFSYTTRGGLELLLQIGTGAWEA